ncbi:DJ-1/ThiJ/PfpI family protein [Ochromonadaceae sp. CCMP2298]|nr:DJ-1/ThiJ/PfpI family protein [Ochromonadaceae sp. CCMP2298]
MSSAGAEKQINVLVPVSKGSEEIETVTIVDTLVRGGATVTLAAVCPNDLEMVLSRGVRLVADCKMSECVSQKWDMIVCPGGMPGAEYLRDCPHLTALLQEQVKAGGYVAAICAAVVLAHHGLLKGPATCYPAPKFTALLSHYSTDAVVVDGNVVTSQGPGTSLAFSLKLVELLFGQEKAAAVQQEMIA